MRLSSKTPLPTHGADSNRSSRFNQLTRSGEALPGDDAWEIETINQRTEVAEETAKSIISYNQSPDIPFDRSINPYRGCQHGCSYCYARPTHAYLGLSPGLDFETKLTVKTNVAELLRRELSRPGYRPLPLALGANTDPYQPLELRRRVTRAILEILAEFHHPVMLTTKGSVIARDMDILSELAAKNLVSVMVSIPTLEPELARRMEPKAATPKKRLEIIRQLRSAGIPVGVNVAPVIPALNDHDIENVLQQAQSAGAATASYTFLRLPLEVRDIFVEWLQTHYPNRAKHVLSVVRQSRGGLDNVSAFGGRMTGEGVFADMIRQRFKLAYTRLGMQPPPPLETGLFQPPNTAPKQLSLFDD